MRLCPEAARRDAMSDGEFWEWVATSILGPQGPDTIDPDDAEQMSAALGPCPECGEFGACGYDELGRELIHVTRAEEG